MTRYYYSQVEVRNEWAILDPERDSDPDLMRERGVDPDDLEKAAAFVLKRQNARYNMLQDMLARQTADEQASLTTSHSNGIGFNGSDAEFLTDVAIKAQKWHSETHAGMTKGQDKSVWKAMRKYSRQMTEIVNARQYARLMAKGKWDAEAAAAEAASLKKVSVMKPKQAVAA